MSTSADYTYVAATIGPTACLQLAKQGRGQRLQQKPHTAAGPTLSRAACFSQKVCLVQAEQAEEYSHTVARLGTILEERRGKYAFADLQVSLQADQHDKVGLPSAVVAYR